MDRTKTLIALAPDPRRLLAMGCATFLILALMAGCARREDRVLFDGEFFRAKVSREDRKARQGFTVKVSPVSSGFEGALQAGEYEATRYCIETYGTSDIDWIVGPEAEAESLPVVNNSLTMAGECRF